MVDRALNAKNIEECHSHLALTMTTLERARSLTRQLLTFAKGGAPLTKVEPLIPFVRETASFALSGSKCSCQFDVPADLWACVYDRSQIGQVIDNLIINAVQAMPNGGHIVLAAENVHLAEGQEPGVVAGCYVRLSVADTGSGIPSEYLPRVSDPFFTTKSSGHGLGLATCYSIMRRHAGNIRVKPRLGGGTVFHLHLPASTAHAAVWRADQSVDHRGFGTILVMDDEAIVRQSMAEMPRSLGDRVVLASTVEETVERLVSERRVYREVRAVFLDPTVPGGRGGKEALAEIRKRDPLLPVFVASGYGDDPAVAEPARFGFTASLCKPILRGDLALFLERHLGGNAAVRSGSS